MKSLKESLLYEMKMKREINYSAESLEKKIASSQAAIDKLNTTIAKKTELINKNLKKIHDITGNTSLTAEAVNVYDLPNSCKEFGYKVEDGVYDVQRATHKLEIETRKLKEYEDKLKTAKPKRPKAGTKEYNDFMSLNTLFTEMLKDFKIDWFNKMTSWHTEHYNKLYEKKPEYDKKRHRIEIVYDTCYYELRLNKDAESFIKGIRESTNRFFSDIVFKYKTLNEYLNYINETLETEWVQSVAKLADKCKKFELDESSLVPSEPSVTPKGFEITIKDKTDKEIYARMIWAAEGSWLVRPHTRYIVTQRKK